MTAYLLLALCCAAWLIAGLVMAWLFCHAPQGEEGEQGFVKHE